MRLLPPQARPAEAPTSPAGRILQLLKLQGPQSTAQIAAALAVSAEAARQHLSRLAAQALVQAGQRSGGVGRPARLWRLSQAGHARFADGHAALAAQVLESAQVLLGCEGVTRLLARREDEMRTAYRQRLADCSTLEQQVAALAELRSAEGYMCTWQVAGEAFLLIENHCPIRAAAQACRALCQSELAVFQAVLGPQVRVRVVAHLSSGAQRCSYHISPR